MAIEDCTPLRKPRLTLRDRRVPVLALSKQESAQALGVSLNFFEQEIAHELKMVRRGRRRLVAVRELERWLEREADLAGNY